MNINEVVGYVCVCVCVYFRPPQRLLLTEQNDGCTARYTDQRCCAEEITPCQEPSSPRHRQS